MNPGEPASVENHRTERESGAIVYPVYSRRSEGLSIGINLFPNKKICSFDCPYCEVFPFETDIYFSLDVMERALIESIQHARKHNIPIRDICFSGNGEPTMSPYFQEALNRAVIIREQWAKEAALVLITNGTMLLHEQTYKYLVEAASGSKRLDIWLKVDAGTEAWYKCINRSEISFHDLTTKITQFAAKAPFTIQTMLCGIDEQVPSSEESSAWIDLITRLALIADKAFGVKSIQIYGKARPAPEDPRAQPLPCNILHERAEALRKALNENGLDNPINVYP